MLSHMESRMDYSVACNATGSSAVHGRKYVRAVRALVTLEKESGRFLF